MDVGSHLQAEQRRCGPEEDTLRRYELSCGYLLGTGTGFEFPYRKGFQILLNVNPVLSDLLVVHADCLRLSVTNLAISTRLTLAGCKGRAGSPRSALLSGGCGGHWRWGGTHIMGQTGDLGSAPPLKVEHTYSQLCKPTPFTELGDAMTP